MAFKHIQMRLPLILITSFKPNLHALMKNNNWRFAEWLGELAVSSSVGVFMGDRGDWNVHGYGMSASTSPGPRGSEGRSDWYGKWC